MSGNAWNLLKKAKHLNFVHLKHRLILHLYQLDKLCINIVWHQRFDQEYGNLDQETGILDQERGILDLESGILDLENGILFLPEICLDFVFLHIVGTQFKQADSLCLFFQSGLYILNHGWQLSVDLHNSMHWEPSG